MTREWWGVAYATMWVIGCAALSAYTANPAHTLGYWEASSVGMVMFVTLDKGLLWITGSGVIPRAPDGRDHAS